MKDPAMLLYTSDFLIGVSFMTMEERGQYITLLCLQHQKGHMNLLDMERVTGKLDSIVLNNFIQDKNGLYYNERADKEIAKRQAYSDSRRLNRAKSNISESDDKHIKNISESHDSDMENENINDNIIKNNIIKNNKKTMISKMSPELLSAFESFSQMRNKIKKPMTDQAMRRMINKLNKMASTDAEKIAILNQSEDHCWCDVYLNKKINQEGSFDTDDFFEAALSRSQK